MADYSISRSDVSGAASFFQKRLVVLRKQIIELLSDQSRDFETLESLAQEYVKAFKTNDYLLGYTDIIEENDLDTIIEKAKECTKQDTAVVSASDLWFVRELRFLLNEQLIKIDQGKQDKLYRKALSDWILRHLGSMPAD